MESSTKGLKRYIGYKLKQDFSWRGQLFFCSANLCFWKVSIQTVLGTEKTESTSPDISSLQVCNLKLQSHLWGSTDCKSVYPTLVCKRHNHVVVVVVFSFCIVAQNLSYKLVWCASPGSIWGLFCSLELWSSDLHLHYRLQLSFDLHRLKWRLFRS